MTAEASKEDPQQHFGLADTLGSRHSAPDNGDVTLESDDQKHIYSTSSPTSTSPQLYASRLHYLLSPKSKQ